MSIKVASVGAGYFSRYHHEAWRRLAGVELAGICDRARARAEAFAREFGIGAVHTDAARMLEAVQPDLLDVIAPPQAHLELVRLAARHGIACICQKPFCRSLGEARAAVRAAADAGTVLVVHENFRFQPWHRQARRLLDEGALGTPFGITFRLRPGDGQGADAYLRRQPYFQRMPRFLVHETGIHLIDTFRYLLGEVRAVTARLARLNPAIAGEDAGLVVFEFERGALGVFDGNRLCDHAADDCRRTMGEMWLEGSRGTLRLDGCGRLWLRGHGEVEEREVRYEWQDRGFGGDCVFALQRHVLAHLFDGAALENSAREYLANLRIEEAVYQSHELGQRVVLGNHRSGRMDQHAT